MSEQKEEEFELGILEGEQAQAVGASASTAATARDTTALLQRIAQQTEAHRLQLEQRLPRLQALLWAAAQPAAPIVHRRRRPSIVLLPHGVSPPPAAVPAPNVSEWEAALAGCRQTLRSGQTENQQLQDEIQRLRIELSTRRDEIEQWRRRVAQLEADCVARVQRERVRATAETESALSERWNVRALWLWTLFVASLSKRAKETLESKAVDSLVNTLPGLLLLAQGVGGGVQQDVRKLQEGMAGLQVLVALARSAAQQSSQINDVGIPDNVRRELQPFVSQLLPRTS